MMRIAHHALGPQRRQQYRSETLKNITVFESQNKYHEQPFLHSQCCKFLFHNLMTLVAYKACKKYVQNLKYENYIKIT